MTDIGRMLIVDDEAPVRELLSDYFVERRFTVITAANGQEALEMFARERPDIVLLDLRMPGLDGLTVLKQLRAADPGVTVIMVTANEDLMIARETLSVGAFDYVAKPFDFDYLDRTVVTAMIHSGRLPGEADAALFGDDPWRTLVADVFRAVRAMEAAARASTGLRLENAALAAAQLAMAGRRTEANAHLAEIRLLIDLAVRLGDLSAPARSRIDAALMTAQAARS